MATWNYNQARARCRPGEGFNPLLDVRLSTLLQPEGYDGLTACSITASSILYAKSDSSLSPLSDV